MAKAKVIHSLDASANIFEGDIEKRLEPSTGIIQFPGGHVEVSRTNNGKYWAHIAVDDAANIVDSRIDYDYEKYNELKGKIPPIPGEGHIEHMAIMIKKKPHA